MPRPLLAVSMPSYHAARSIAEPLASVLTRTVQDWELIIVHDTSSDGTLDVVAEVQQRTPRIQRVAKNANHRRQHACKRGLEPIRGDLIVSVGSDDGWSATKPTSRTSEYKRRRDDE